MKNYKAKNENGVSLIALVITIIVVIILAAITFGTSTRTITNANYSDYVNNVGEVYNAFHVRAMTIKGQEAAKGNNVTDAQVYNYLASNSNEFLVRADLPDYTIIKDEGQIGMKLPKMRVESGTGKMVTVKYAVTREGDIFTWPPFDYEDGFKMNAEDIASSKLATSITVKNKTFMISLSEDTGELIEEGENFVESEDLHNLSDYFVGKNIQSDGLLDSNYIFQNAAPITDANNIELVALSDGGTRVFLFIRYHDIYYRVLCDDSLNVSSVDECPTGEGKTDLEKLKIYCVDLLVPRSFDYSSLGNVPPIIDASSSIQSLSNLNNRNDYFEYHGSYYKVIRNDREITDVQEITSPLFFLPDQVYDLPEGITWGEFIENYDLSGKYGIVKRTSNPFMGEYVYYDGWPVVDSQNFNPFSATDEIKPFYDYTYTVW